MESTEQIDSKIRTIGQMNAGELSWKLKSKQDFIDYLDKRDAAFTNDRDGGPVA